MLTVDLSILKVGDVILETGDERVTRLTQGTYGHAAILMGRLVCLEAGTDNGVEVSPFPLCEFSNGVESFIGFEMHEGDKVSVRRSADIRDTGTLFGETLWEAGRAYSYHKLANFPNLSPKAKQRLERFIPKDTELDEDERFCSEVVAHVLKLPSGKVTPDDLAANSDLVEVDGAVRDLDDQWTATKLDIQPIKSALAGFAAGHAKRMLADLERVANTLRGLPKDQQEQAVQEHISALECSFKQDVSEGVGALEAVRKLEQNFWP